MPPPPLQGILEAVLYAPDLEAAQRFFVGVLGLSTQRDGRPLMIALRVSEGQVLLVFDPGQSLPAGREVPSHGASGPGHVALRIERGDLGLWRKHLAASGVPIEQEAQWPDGARSIYLRDPAGNSIELITGDIWS